MYQDHYFLEKSMEQHSRRMEKESRRWWTFGRGKAAEEPAMPAPGVTHAATACSGRDRGVCCEAYAVCQL